MLKPETKIKDGAYLARFTFDALDPTDYSDNLVRFLSTVAVRMGVQHVTIECKEGIPDWLDKAICNLAGFGMPISITGSPISSSLEDALLEAVGPYPGQYSW